MADVKKEGLGFDNSKTRALGPVLRRQAPSHKKSKIGDRQCACN
jgi:hypothetical protein